MAGRSSPGEVFSIAGEFMDDGTLRLLRPQEGEACIPRLINHDQDPIIVPLKVLSATIKSDLMVGAGGWLSGICSTVGPHVRGCWRTSRYGAAASRSSGKSQAMPAPRHPCFAWPGSEQEL